MNKPPATMNNNFHFVNSSPNDEVIEYPEMKTRKVLRDNNYDSNGSNDDKSNRKERY